MTATATQGDVSAKQTQAAFQFVAELAAEVSRGRVELPAYPDVATRVRKALADENVSPEHISRIVGSEAGLAARVMTLANSAALNRGGKNITELKTAINRIGQNNVRTAAVAFAIAQLRRASELKHIIKDLEKLWNNATMVSALAYTIASRSRGINADEALLAGLIHNVGKIYILARAYKHAELFADTAAMNMIMREWHASIGKAIIENWGFAPHIAEAVGAQEEFDRVAGQADIADVLTVSIVASSFIDDKDVDLELNMQGIRGFSRLGLNNDKFRFIMSDCVEEISALRSALGT